MKMMENGMQKKVTEPYLVDALSFTEAEARIIEEIRPFITGEFTVTDIKRARLSELFFNEQGDRFYKIKVYFITLDEKSGAEKKTAAQMLAQASTLKEAIAVLEEGMKGTLADYVIASVAETQLMDVFPFDANSIPSEKSGGASHEISRRSGRRSRKGYDWWRSPSFIRLRRSWKLMVPDKGFLARAVRKSWWPNIRYCLLISSGILLVPYRRIR